ncbi:hypothetical protein LCGC14_2048260 [marine sediment metagenome]|uniref:Uncharacterized protein n=1 Tax=marine sediment metagenome TaxID=412755 RepID=A0A0F9EPW7_9ZZZZ
MFKFNYGEYILQQLITTDFIQLKLAHILISLVVNFINMHIVTLLCMIISVNVYIDFFLQIGISVTMALKIGHIYNFVERYEAEFYTFTQYLINNYSIDNYRYWKRLFVMTACVYACLVLLLVQLTNQLVFFYIIQYVICFLIIEQFEQQRIQKWIREYQRRPIAKRLINDPASDFLINSYMSPHSKVLRPKRSAPRHEKPIVRVQEPSKFYLIAKQCSGSITAPNQLKVRQDQKKSALRKRTKL